MRHQKKRHKLGRTAAHRKATLAALGNALIQHKRITTTEPKAKALRGFIEPLITRAKEDSSHNRRQVFRRLQDNDAVSELFTDVSAQVGDRPGGYTRVVKLGRRAGDGAPLAVIELVDYNDVQPGEGATGRGRTRRGGGRGRRSRSKGTETQQPAAIDTSTETVKQVETASKDVEADVVDVPVAEEQTQPVQARTEEDATTEQVDAAQEAIEEQKAEANRTGKAAEEDEMPPSEGRPEAEGDSAVEAPSKAERKSEPEGEPKAEGESEPPGELKEEGESEPGEEPEAEGRSAEQREEKGDAEKGK